MRRGDVWWVDFGERRPVVLLSESADGTFRAIQIVEPANVDITGLGLEVAVGPVDGCPLAGVIRVAFPGPDMVPCTWLATVTEQDLIALAGTVPESRLNDIEQALRLGGSLAET